MNEACLSPPSQVVEINSKIRGEKNLRGKNLFICLTDCQLGIIKQKYRCYVFE